MSVEVTCRDLETGETETQVVRDGDYVLITTAPCEVTYIQVFSGGKTHQLTIKNRIQR